MNGENELPLYTYLKSQKGFEEFSEHPYKELLEKMFSEADPDWDNNLICQEPRTLVVRGFVFPGSVPDSGQINVVFSCVRNRSAIGENVWYFFHTRYSFVSSRGVSGRNTSPLPGEVSTSLLNVR